MPVSIASTSLAAKPEKKVDGHTNDLPLKRGRVQLIQVEARRRRRSSTGVPNMNPIPQPPGSSVSPRQLFIFGTGDMGQFGLGPDQDSAEIPRPKLHAWFAEHIEEEGGGIESVACGGMHTLAIDERGRVWSWGINDNAALGRVTVDVPDPKDPSKTIPTDHLETVPFVLDSLEKEGFRAAQVAAGDSVSIAISDKGKLRAWGSFRVSKEIS